MESVGQKLREERQRQGLTLEVVSARTRISIKSLQAIESDAVSQFSSAFFYKSFARQFAEFLGVDFSTMSSAVQQSAASLPPPRIPGEDGIALPNVPALLPARSRNLRWLHPVGSLVAVTVACSTFYAVWRHPESNLHAVASRLYSSIQSVASASHQSGRVATTATPSASTARNTTPPAVPSASEGSEAVPYTKPGDQVFKVEVSAVERTWLSIVSDGRRVYSGVLLADESKMLEAHDSGSIKTGNAGGLEVVFNGKQIGPLGAKGQVRTVMFTRDNFEIVPPPVHVALTMFTKPIVE